MRARPFGDAPFFLRRLRLTYRGLFCGAGRQDLDGAFDLERAADQADRSCRPGASWLRLAVYLSSALPPSPSRIGPSPLVSSLAVFSSAIFDRPCETKLTTSRRRDFGAIQQMDRMALLLAEDGDEQHWRRRLLSCPRTARWNTARCRTRWKPSVGCTSRSSSFGRRGVVRSRCSLSESLSRARSAPQARRISRTLGCRGWTAAGAPP